MCNKRTIMSVAEMKKEIVKKIESFDEIQLKELMKFVNTVENNSSKKINLLKNIDTIFAEREEVLRRLAK